MNWQDQTLSRSVPLSIPHRFGIVTGFVIIIYASPRIERSFEWKAQKYKSEFSKEKALAAYYSIKT